RKCPCFLRFRGSATGSGSGTRPTSLAASGSYAIVDVVTRYWIGYLVSTEQTHTQVQLLFARALEDQGLLGADGLPPDQGPEDPPILVAWSDNGTEMTATDTRQFMALMTI